MYYIGRKYEDPYPALNLRVTHALLTNKVENTPGGVCFTGDWGLIYQAGHEMLCHASVGCGSNELQYSTFTEGMITTLNLEWGCTWLGMVILYQFLCFKFRHILDMTSFCLKQYQAQFYSFFFVCHIKTHKSLANKYIELNYYNKNQEK